MPGGRFNVLVVTSRNRSATEIVAWTALSAVAPGAAHLRAGWRRTGFALLGCYGLLLTGAVTVVLRADAGMHPGETRRRSGHRLTSTYL